MAWLCRVCYNQLVDMRNYEYDDLADLFSDVDGMYYVSSWENYDISVALNLAVEHGHEKCVDALIRAGADVNEGYPIDWAVWKGHDKCLDLLIKAGADVEPGLLMKASKRGHVKCIKLLLKAGVNVNATGDYDTYHTDDKTALMLASEENKEASVISLIELGADVNFKNSRGETAVYYAASGGAKDCLVQLIKAGADVNDWIDTHESPLHAALEARSSRCVIHLLNEGAGHKAMKVSNLLESFAHVNDVSSMKRILREGARVNEWSEPNALETYIERSIYLKDRGKYDNKTRASKRMCMLLFAAGEKIKQPKIIIYCDELPWAANVPQYLLESESSLKNKCREAIRNHLLELDPHTNLFLRIPTMNLPPSLVRYLLYGFSPEDNDEDDNLYEDSEEPYEDDEYYNDSDDSFYNW